MQKHGLVDMGWSLTLSKGMAVRMFRSLERGDVPRRGWPVLWGGTLEEVEHLTENSM